MRKGKKRKLETSRFRAARLELNTQDELVNFVYKRQHLGVFIEELDEKGRILAKRCIENGSIVERFRILYPAIPKCDLSLRSVLTVALVNAP